MERIHSTEYTLIYLFITAMFSSMDGRLERVM